MPQLDDDRRVKQQTVNSESHKQAELSARMEALKALQEKVRTDGKLRPWLAKHGLENLQALWSRIHIEQGWENALEAALPAMTMPSLLYAGTKDDVFARAEKSAQAMPNCTFIALPGLDHSDAFYKATELVVPKVLSFLRTR